MLQKVTAEFLIYTYDKAKLLKLDAAFILLLEEEIIRRGKKSEKPCCKRRTGE
jgi:hypothetical protein